MVAGEKARPCWFTSYCHAESRPIRRHAIMCALHFAATAMQPEEALGGHHVIALINFTSRGLMRGTHYMGSRASFCKSGACFLGHGWHPSYVAADHLRAFLCQRHSPNPPSGSNRLSGFHNGPA
jgi:hypothetical protein